MPYLVSLPLKLSSAWMVAFKLLRILLPHLHDLCEFQMLNIENHKENHDNGCENNIERKIDLVRDEIAVVAPRILDHMADTPNQEDGTAEVSCCK